MTTHPYLPGMAGRSLGASPSTTSSHQTAPSGSGSTLPFQPHSGPSRQAARAGKAHAASQRDRVLVYLKSRGAEGGTDEEGALALAMNPSTYRPRRVELVRAGSVADSGATRRGLSGSRMSVWIAT
jgi:hypothetical protein